MELCLSKMDIECLKCNICNGRRCCKFSKCFEPFPFWSTEDGPFLYPSALWPPKEYIQLSLAKLVPGHLDSNGPSPFVGPCICLSVRHNSRRVYSIYSKLGTAKHFLPNSNFLQIDSEWICLPYTFCPKTVSFPNIKIVFF